ncbi:hypothetical protein [Phaeobacter sp. C3_T13_0]|uniref:hypothetical protein n=1 Tax=Phaeobacter cretensis TaxID=3342641 RepID=UPI0039BCF4FE
MMAVEQSCSMPLVAASTGETGYWTDLHWQPDVALRLFGMRRSGNHAIANWLQRNAPTGQALFFNNCKPKRAPLTHHQGIERNGLRLSRQNGRDLAALGASIGRGGLLLLSYEDVVPSDYTLDRPVSGDLDETFISGDILLIRGFLNWSASLTKKLQGNPDFSVSHRSAIVLRAIDSYRRMLDLAGQAGDLALTVIDYDIWVREAKYRADCLDDLGLPCVDNTLGEVQSYGGGSSFDGAQAGTDFDLATDQRWRQMDQNSEYQAILHLAARDEALIEVLTHHYPVDATRLVRLADYRPFTAGGLL